MSNKMLISGITLIVLGVIVGIITTLNYYDFKEAVENNEVILITADVVDSSRSFTTDTKDQYTFTDIYEYEVDGVVYSGTETVKSTRASRTAPDSYEIYYYEDNPSNHFLAKDSTIVALFVWVIPVVGLGVLIGGYFRRIKY